MVINSLQTHEANKIEQQKLKRIILNYSNMEDTTTNASDFQKADNYKRPTPNSGYRKKSTNK